jgi:DNA helicase-2/ATP-dependent DNA helicase PcrA
VIAYLRLLGNPAADSAFERIVNAPPRGIGDTTVDRLRAAARASGSGLLDAARLAAHGEVAGLGPAPRRKLQSFVELIDGLNDVIAQGASVAETIIQVVDRSGMRAKLEADQSAESRDRLDNLAELVSTATDFDDEVGTPGYDGPERYQDIDGVEQLPPSEGEGQPGRTVDAFLERIALSSAGDQATAAEQVVLMTIHIAKGLEWPIVFISGLEDGLFPSLRERDGTSEDAALEEERRLAYVAITRARERLVLTHARSRRVWGETRFQDPSRFLDDIPPSCLASSPAAARARMVPTGPRVVDGNFRAPASSGQWRRPNGAGAAGRRGRDELDQRPDDEHEPVYRLDDGQLDDGAGSRDAFTIGAPVSHSTLGAGRVVAVAGTGKDQKVVVDFGSLGRKTVFARFLAASDDSLN